MVTPSEFAKAVLPQGTTTVIADPHEIANVCGINGISFMINQAKGLPMNIFYMMPSCVPSTNFENNGAHINSDLIAAFVNNENILGLGEVMDYEGVLECKEDLLKKIDLFDDKIIDGHSPGLTGKALNAYRAAGVVTDHECSTIEEGIERLRLGMYLQIREGSAARNLEKLIMGLLTKGIPFNRAVFCTDDKHLEDIKKEGHINYNVRKAISFGVDPIDAISMATINTAQCYRLKRLGAVAIGYSADLIILNSLEEFEIDKVLFRGEIICENGKLTKIINTKIEDKNVFNTVRIRNIKKEDLNIRLSQDKATVISIIPRELITKKEIAAVKVKDGLFTPDDNYSKIAVIERHKATNNIGLGIVKNFNIKNGAIASTVAHDSHNLIVIGDNDEDMLLAIKELKKVNGGFTVVGAGGVKATLELPIAGLISDKSMDYVVETLERLINEAKKLGINEKLEPFITLSFLALPVIPEIRVTDRGLFDVTNFKFINI